MDGLTDELATRSDLPRPLLTVIARTSIDAAREAMRTGGDADAAAIAAERVTAMERSRPAAVINATGVLLHTNLGRAPWHAAATAAGSTHNARYGNVEIDAEGRRSKRGAYPAALLASLTGAETALVVNNNAGALMLALAALAGAGGRVAVSRGELIEIGGSFRLPELIAAAGVRLVEVGTTNRTRIEDYERVASRVDALLKVHPSNYRIEGFAEEAGYGELGELAAAHGLPFIADVGSGLLDADAPWLSSRPAWLGDEPAMAQTVRSGATVVLASGDKLFGGPQAGLVAGTGGAVARMAAHPIARAVRCDGHRLAAVAATLELYATGRGGEIPLWRMASLGAAELIARSEALVAAAGRGSVIEASSVLGAGSVPGLEIPTPAVQLPERDWYLLASADPMILATRRAGSTVVNLRAVDPDDDARVAAALGA